jgi:hypothetical protein
MRNFIIIILATFSMSHAGVDVGNPAPNFTLPSSSGKNISLSDFKEKTIVLEWINHGSPFVFRQYDSGRMQKLQATAKAKGIIWLTICSSAPGKHGHMTPAQAEMIYSSKKSAATAYLMDESGAVARSYGATCTPEMFVINPEGLVAYHGAFDDDRTSPDSGTIPLSTTKNYVQRAIEEILEGKPVSIPKTELFGSGISYAQ